MPSQVSGFAALALKSLSPTQIAFIVNLPKAELHAHLNGSIPIATLQELARDFPVGDDQSDQVEVGLEKLQHPDGVGLEEIHDFFGLFPAIYALTATPEALRRATRSVLREFLEIDDSIGGPQCTYIELRTIPKSTGLMSRGEYARVVLDEIEKYPVEQAALIISVDRKMNETEMGEVVDLAVSLKEEGRRVVGIDVCGNPLNGDMNRLERHILKAKGAGLGVTLHIAETKDNPPAETLKLLSYEPNRLGHATFLDAEAKGIVIRSPDVCIEICLSSNLLCKTVPSLEDHHIGYYLDRNHPVAICTDDILPFRNSLLGEYALLMAAPPIGLGLKEAEVTRIAEMSLRSRFGH
ncbi:adenosine deaminase-like protein [Pleurotus eryngii]|uniref:Adenosine deaminase-like protein n=1 Tax=Pleurotus eryngii TaxID=5323 RepID=A0A9P5ZTN0_PLEER|nr:adenosine deaminase-like protein [Pleurotus eryngii]